MTRIALGIEYDGTAYSGWQTQPHARSVQQELERALSRVADHTVTLTAAGRTDAGVHALGQVAHFDSEAPRPLHAWVLGTNAESANDVSVLWARAVPVDFNARHSALSRSYLYRMLNGPMRPALERDRVCWRREPLDAGRMHAAAQVLVGEHDFSSFRAAQCQSRTPIRRVREISVVRSGDYLDLRVRANAFLHHMVRNIAGVLLAVGRGDRPPQWVAELLDVRDRTLAGVTAPPQGLYLAGVEYPSGFELPSGRLHGLRPGATP
jgi:tRNA pseudouridine38-40 synthase